MTNVIDVRRLIDELGTAAAERQALWLEDFHRDLSRLNTDPDRVDGHLTDLFKAGCDQSVLVQLLMAFDGVMGAPISKHEFEKHLKILHETQRVILELQLSTVSVWLFHGFPSFAGLIR